MSEHLQTIFVSNHWLFCTKILNDSRNSWSFFYITQASVLPWFFNTRLEASFFYFLIYWRTACRLDLLLYVGACKKPQKAYSAPMDGHRVFLDCRIAKTTTKKIPRALLLAIYRGKKRPQSVTFVQILSIVKPAVAPHYCCKQAPLLLQHPVYMRICIPHCVDTSIVNALSKIITFALYFLQA